MSTLALSSIRRVTRIVVGAAIHNSDDASTAIADAGRDLLLVTMNGDFRTTVTAKKSAAHIVAGAIEASNQAGGDTPNVIRSIVQGTIKGAWESGADVGPVAVKSISAAVQIAVHIGIDFDQAVMLAVEGAIGVADQIGVEATQRIIDYLENSIRYDKKWHRETFGMAEVDDVDRYYG